MNNYWLITYIWNSRTRQITAMDLHEGRIADWVLMALDQPENWQLINSVQLTEEEYGDLQGKVG